MQLTSLKLIAYVRDGSEALGTGTTVQLSAIKSYCNAHGYRLKAIYSDPKQPSFGLRQALQSLQYADGMITYDLNRMVSHEDDSFRELRPLIQNAFMHGRKRLITIGDGIENVTPAGQENLMELMNEWSRRTDAPMPSCESYEHMLHNLRASVEA